MARNKATDRKCAEILACIVNTCNEKQNSQHNGPVVGFGPDWGDHSLTVYRKGDHTHVGCISGESSFAELVDQLHALLIEGEGLSWA